MATTRPRPKTKPKWPYARIVRMTCDRHRNQWVKQIHGRRYSFGPLDDPAEALRRWQIEGPRIEAGLPLNDEPQPDSITVHEICGLYLQAKEAAVATGVIAERTLRDYRDTVAHVCRHYPRSWALSRARPGDWEKLLRSIPWGPTRLSNFVTWTKMIFRWAHDVQLIKEQPRFSKAFKGGTMKQKRELRYQSGLKMFEAAQVRRLVELAEGQLEALVLLGVNAGFGNTDCARLPRSAVDLKQRLINWPRPKTMIERQAPLRPKTAQALEAVMKGRPPAAKPEDEGLVFITSHGAPWIHGTTDAVGLMFGRLVRKVDLGLNGTSRLGYFWLRRTFRTVAEQAGDVHATHRIMGHAIPGKSGVYIQRVEVEQLRKVTDHVRSWVWPE